MKRLLVVAATLALAAPSAFAARARGIDLDTDRARADDAAVILTADQRYLAFQEHRVEMLNASWQLEIAKGHPQEAGMLAVEHWKALQDERRAQAVLDHARNEFVSARERLIVDEFELQHA
jgi:hypothetical protein